MFNKEETVKRESKFSVISASSETTSSSITPTSCSLWSAQKQQQKEQQEQKFRNTTPITTPKFLPKISSTIPQNSSTQKTIQVNPMSLKNSLEEILGINKEKYWLSMQSFIRGEINKIELDFYVHSLLPKEYVHLHDEFIRASIKLKNTRKKNKNDVKHVKSSASSSSQSQKEKSLKKIMSTMRKEERDKLHVILESTIHTNSNLMLFEKKFPRNTTINDDFADSPISTMIPPNEEGRGFSEFDSIYTKMTEIALDNGLIGGVSEDCAKLMIYALETHLKNVVHSCINKIRSNDFHNEKEKISISLSDLVFSLEISPYILVENNFILERILNKISQKL